ncbi:MAG: DUF3726 domain-containing protein [Alphaproteobacteria bacterium]|nr:DUF3726 domain-containing protein [Alphaproteobacteria bacterium]
MSDFSIKELEMLCLKAARGAGYPWGLAEEAGFSAGWAAKRGVTDLADFAAHLQAVGMHGHEKMTPKQGEFDSQHHFGPMCPIIMGTYLSDRGRQIDLQRTVVVEELACPLYLLAFLASVSSATDDWIAVSAPTFNAVVSADGLEISFVHGTRLLQAPETVTLSKAEFRPQAVQPVHARVSLRPEVLEQLTTLAARTYVPESDELMAADAGGANVDTD